MKKKELLGARLACGKLYNVTYTCPYHGLVTKVLKLKEYSVTRGDKGWTLFDSGLRSSSGALLAVIKDIDIIDINRI
jgi:hypothetical protein